MVTVHAKLRKEGAHPNGAPLTKPNASLAILETRAEEEQYQSALAVHAPGHMSAASTFPSSRCSTHLQFPRASADRLATAQQNCLAS